MKFVINVPSTIFSICFSEREYVSYIIHMDGYMYPGSIPRLEPDTFYQYRLTRPVSLRSVSSLQRPLARGD